MNKTFSFLVFSLLLFIAEVNAASVLGVVSPRNAPDMLMGAQRILKAHPELTIQLRTTDQFQNLNEKERRQLVREADLVFLGGVYGVPAEWFKQHVYATGNDLPNFIAVHSDRALVRASRIERIEILRNANMDALMGDLPPGFELKPQAWYRKQLEQYSRYQPWLVARTFWADRHATNTDGLLRHLFSLINIDISVPEPRLRQSLRVFKGGEINAPLEDIHRLSLNEYKHWVAILDYESGDRPGEHALTKSLCRQLAAHKLGCLRVLAKWGEASVKAVELLAQHETSIAAIVSIQNFVVGGGDGRKAVNDAFSQLNVPVLKGIRLTNVSESEWRLSEEGLRWDSVHYRVAMPEIQGVIEPLVVAAMSTPDIDPRTGLEIALSQAITGQVNLLVQRLLKWIALQHKQNSEKKVAIVYYNHPPGRHNIGADNLNVPASLFEILTAMKAAGYDTGELPDNEDQLLDRLQKEGVNLPEDKVALTEMAALVTTVSAEQYEDWFKTLSLPIQMEMENGPLGLLNVLLKQAVELEDRSIGKRLLKRVAQDLHHVLDGADHPSRGRVEKLLKQLEDAYAVEATKVDWEYAQALVDAITEAGIEGIRGWGKAPGRVMVHNHKILIPGIQFGNVFVGPQPPRGWELNEELLHANLSFPPPHQYIAFYHWLRNAFNADAVVHLGRHSTYEFLPRHRVGLNLDDYSLALLGDMPSVYPYIVDGVGEGIQAKRRGLAVMVDHLTPPLDSTELYDRLLELRQLVESYEAAPETAGAMRERAIEAMKLLVDELKLKDELIESMSGELEVRGITEFDQVDDELLVHEIGHYLTHLQEDFMPLGLHKFGRDWTGNAIDTMLGSMSQGQAVDSLVLKDWKTNLSASPRAEMGALLEGLSGGYIAPAKGNDPIRTPEVLPTGRNFFALDGSLIPSRLGYEVGVELAKQARTNASKGESDGIVLWASDVVRDEGAMIAFGFDMLGVKPEWSSRGIVKRLVRLDMKALTEHGVQRTRRDTIFTTSGLFRDLYGAHLVWLDRAVLMALDASSNLIREKYPALSFALNGALEPLGKLQSPGDEPLEINLVAARWVDDAKAALKQGVPAERAGRIASYRIFGDAPGTYGAGVNRVVERSGSWENRSEVAAVYLKRMGHAYGANLQGESALEVFKQRLAHVGNTYMGRSSNLYGLLDNNDAFDYLGGLSLAVETVKGAAPDNFIMFHPDQKRIAMEPLQTALLSELRGQFLNPQWLKPLMDEGYAGARTMGSEFLEYLWGWQVTNPDVIKSWVWDEVKAVYIDDKLNLQLDEFLEQKHNVHVKTNMIAVMLVAAQKGFWAADDEALQSLSQKFSRLIIENGLPGSGHTNPNHPIYEWVEDYVDPKQYAKLKAVVDASKFEEVLEKNTPLTISEITMTEAATSEQHEAQKVVENAAESDSQATELNDYLYVMGALFIMLLVAGWIRGMNSASAILKSHSVRTKKHADRKRVA